MDTSCQYASSCDPGHVLPMTGLELFALVGFAVACVALGFLMRYSHRGVGDE